MIPDAARMRRWMLLGAPVMLLASLGMHAGGAAAGMMAWALLGVRLLPASSYPYPRKRNGKPWRLFFSFSAGLFLLGASTFIADCLFSFSRVSRVLFLWGEACLSVSVMGRMLFLALPRRFCRIIGPALFFLSLLFIFYRR